jgi:hypothetical protein
VADAAVRWAASPRLKGTAGGLPVLALAYERSGQVQPIQKILDHARRRNNGRYDRAGDLYDGGPNTYWVNETMDMWGFPYAMQALLDAGRIAGPSVIPVELNTLDSANPLRVFLREDQDAEFTLRIDNTLGPPRSLQVLRPDGQPAAIRQRNLGRGRDGVVELTVPADGLTGLYVYAPEQPTGNELRLPISTLPGEVIHFGAKGLQFNGDGGGPLYVFIPAGATRATLFGTGVIGGYPFTVTAVTAQDRRVVQVAGVTGRAETQRETVELTPDLTGQQWNLWASAATRSRIGLLVEHPDWAPYCSLRSQQWFDPRGMSPAVPRK